MTSSQEGQYTPLRGVQVYLRCCTGSTHQRGWPQWLLHWRRLRYLENNCRLLSVLLGLRFCLSDSNTVLEIIQQASARHRRSECGLPRGSLLQIPDDSHSKYGYPQADFFNVSRSRSRQRHRTGLVTLNSFTDPRREGRARLLVRLFSFSGAHLEPISHGLLLRSVQTHTPSYKIWGYTRSARLKYCKVE